MTITKYPYCIGWKNWFICLESEVDVAPVEQLRDMICADKVKVWNKVRLGERFEVQGLDYPVRLVDKKTSNRIGAELQYVKWDGILTFRVEMR